MKQQQPSPSALVRTEAARAHPPPAVSAGNAETVARLSSLAPHLVVLFAVIGAAVAFGFAGKQLLSSATVSWSLLALGFAHAGVALAGFIMWKRIRRGADHYHVSDFVRSESISFVDVCMVVKERGLIWDRVHIHFKRMTRFGWSVAYVPVRPTGDFASLIAAWRRRLSTSGQMAEEN